MELITADVERVAPPPSSPVDEVVGGIDAFGLRAEQMLAAEGNTVLSPTSIAVAFAMVSAAADDVTAERIAELFGFPAAPDVHEAMNSLVADRPYLFAVRHVETGAPLFVGRVADPMA